MSANLENSAVATGNVSFHPNPKERQWQKAFKELKIALISYANQVLLIIIQARFQQYMNHELPDVQTVFRKCRGTRDQIANICWIIKKEREFQKNIYFCFIAYTEAFDRVDQKNCGIFFKR